MDVHPAQDVKDLLRHLDRYEVGLRKKQRADVLRIELWLPAAFAWALATSPSVRRRLRSELNSRCIGVWALNAYSYGDMPRGGSGVHSPDWTDPRRELYTRNCAVVLSDLLSDDAPHGCVSTLPLAKHTRWSALHDVLAEVAIENVTKALTELERPVRLVFSPESGCVLGTVTSAVAWLAHRVDPAHVGLCVDLDHVTDPTGDVAVVLNSETGLLQIRLSAAAEDRLVAISQALSEETQIVVDTFSSVVMATTLDGLNEDAATCLRRIAEVVGARG
ncbi:hypothetical protein JNUCC0626_13530 [Lentzea sp. JNUCC 0626]|uniref:hypothetical protein n=1 Tax=Lentzea sp. JNUCC 0626 TaxID=3367513 RepID=UPI00374A5CFE